MPQHTSELQVTANPSPHILLTPLNPIQYSVKCQDLVLNWKQSGSRMHEGQPHPLGFPLLWTLWHSGMVYCKRAAFVCRETELFWALAQDNKTYFCKNYDRPHTFPVQCKACYCNLAFSDHNTWCFSSQSERNPLRSVLPQKRNGEEAPHDR